MAKKTKRTKRAVKTAKQRKIQAPPSIAELLAVAKTIKGIKVPENMIASRDKLAVSATKLSGRILKSLGSEAKKADRDAKAKVRAEAKANRDKVKNDKKLAKIADLKAKLVALES